MAGIKRLTELTGYITERVYQNADKAVTGQIMQDVLVEIAQNAANDTVIMCDPEITVADIGKTLGLNLETGLAVVYTEEPEQEGEKTVYRIRFNDKSLNPDGVRAKVEVEFTGNPADGYICYIMRPELAAPNDEIEITILDTVVTPITILADRIQLESLRGGTLEGTLANLCDAIELTDKFSCSSNTDTITITDADAAIATNNYDVANGTWNWIGGSVSPSEVFFYDGLNALARSIRVLAYGLSTLFDLIPTDWMSYGTIDEPADAQEEAIAFTAYVEANLPGWSADWQESSSDVLISMDAFPDLELGPPELSKLNLPNIEIFTEDNGAPFIPQRSAMPFIGVMGGLYEEAPNKYVVIQNNNLTVLTLAPNNAIDLSHYDFVTLTTMGGNTPPSGYMVAAEGGKVRQWISYYDLIALVGIALESKELSGDDQTVAVRIIDPPLIGGV